MTNEQREIRLTKLWDDVATELIELNSKRAEEFDREAAVIINENNNK